MDVINVNSLKVLFIELGWDDMNPAEVNDWLVSSGISPIGFYAYCSALKENPAGLDDTTITGVSANELPYIRDKLHDWKVLYI